MDHKKINLFKEANTKLNIFDDMNLERNKNLIIVYCPPKVGSTSIVSSLRLFGSSKYTVLHIHNEIMLKVLYNIIGVTVLEIIEYNKFIGKNVYVIDIYRSPIEQKMSAFFETINTFHFSTSLDNLNTYPMDRILKRFHHIFSHLANHDYYREKYELGYVECFDFIKRYIMKEKNGVKYIKLRLKDSEHWSNVLSEIFKMEIKVVKDYETESKPIKDLYQKFKEEYRIPLNLLEDVKEGENLKFYYNENERNEYLEYWEKKKMNDVFRSYTKEEFALYNEVSVENQYLNETHAEHYIDMGCICIACCKKRRKVVEKIKKGEKMEGKIIHEEAKLDMVREKVNVVKRQIYKLSKTTSNRKFMRGEISFLFQK